MYSYGPPHMAGQKQDDQLEHTYNSYVRIRDVALKTSQRQWTIGRSGERGSGISVLVAYDDDDDEFSCSFLHQAFKLKFMWRNWYSCSLEEFPILFYQGDQISIWSIAVHAFLMWALTSLSVNEILLPRYVNWFTNFNFIWWRCPWRNSYRRRKWTRRHEFKSWTWLIAFHIALIPLGKVWVQLFSLQLWVK